MKFVRRTKIQETHLEQAISQETIAVRAYGIWQEQGRPAGQDVQHWLQAEAELAAAAAAPTKPVRKRTTRRTTTTTRRRKTAQ